MTDSMKVSKFLSYVLRHKPDFHRPRNSMRKAGQTFPELISKSPEELELTNEVLRSIVAANDKKRFKLSSDGTRIRANQGHSIDIDLQLQTRNSRLKNCFTVLQLDLLPQSSSRGLLPGQRQHVHLSDNRQTASAVGKRPRYAGGVYN